MFLSNNKIEAVLQSEKVVTSTLCWLLLLFFSLIPYIQFSVCYPPYITKVVTKKKSNTKIGSIYRLQQMWISILREDKIKKKYSCSSPRSVIQSKNLKSRKQGKTGNFSNLQIGNKMWAIHRPLSIKGPGSFCAFLCSEFCICMNKAELCSYYLYNHLCCAIFVLCLM